MLHLHIMFSMGVSGEFPVDVCDDIYLCYISTSFLLRAFQRGLRGVAGGVSGELSFFSFYFMCEPFFATLKQKRVIFCYPIVKRTRVSTGTRGLGIRRGTPSTVQR
jgi:hypothetical protein